MKFLIFILTTRRAFPRLKGFSYNDEYQKFLYQGRSLTSDEFNEGVEIFLNKPLNARGYTISVQAIETEPVIETAAEQKSKKSK